MAFLFLSFGFSFASYSQSKELTLPKALIINVRTGTKNSSGTALLVFYNCYFKDYDASDFILDLEMPPYPTWNQTRTRTIQSKSWSDISNVMNVHMATLGYALKDFKDWRTDPRHLEFVNITYEQQ